MPDHQSLPIPSDDDTLAELLRLLGYTVKITPGSPLPRAHFVHAHNTVGTPDRQDSTTPKHTMAEVRLHLANSRTVGDLQSKLALFFVAPKREPDAAQISALLVPRTATAAAEHLAGMH